MRRTYRTGAAVAATTTLLTGAGFAFASLRDATAQPPAKVATVYDTPPAPSEPDVDASLAELRDEAADLKAEIAAREKARKAAAARSEGADRDDPEPAATSRAATDAPATDATTGASGAGGDEEGEDDD